MGRKVIHQGIEVDLDDDVSEELLDVGADSRARPADFDVDEVYRQECRKIGVTP